MQTLPGKKQANPKKRYTSPEVKDLGAVQSKTFTGGSQNNDGSAVSS